VAHKKTEHIQFYMLYVDQAIGQSLKLIILIIIVKADEGETLQSSVKLGHQ